MKHVFFLSKARMAAAVAVLTFGGLLGFNYFSHHSIGVMGQTTDKEFSIITTEYKSTTDDGKIIEVYRWNPGTIVVNEGDRVTLRFIGVQGKFHPFKIEGLGLSGEVKKGRETVVTFTADKKGTYPIVCEAHFDLAHNGPMTGWLVVQ